MFMITIMITVLFILIGVAFLTLMERKVLSYIQIRKGPNKVGIIGILQPFSDAIKLFLKESNIPMLSNYLIYMISPVLGLFNSLLLWVIYPYLINCTSFNMGMMFFFCCTSMGVYSLMITGWSSNSNYAMLGCIRSIAQTISYEVSLVLIILCPVMMIESFNLIEFYFFQQFMWLAFLFFPLKICWISSAMAETNRSPFDFSEGESELVSGFNVEYSGVSFAFIFLAEYVSIIFMSMMFCLMFLGSKIDSLIFPIQLTLISFLFIWVRGTLPRYRYDSLMYLAWKSYLPVSLNLLIFFFMIKSII
uniref:NADH-ubiquinone oxidoreductase chain 1 n=2 Tax=decim group TaxID=254007 RepID=A0A3S5GKX3_9HEMI|nr:NADH dehydrogenase subunit 1 [Magicicada septendecim]YP_009590070.1 NADH dehydrogenase subunit 1 [Magicicada neotredecim]AWV83496.1 NADH dehydrogenase subunit 1 [Magicicada neotredecim]AWV83509.1 NADH dehydrogenase subunit 1 [Magicicada septendecim]QBM07976.1 NADH dehydrogenase subunit 1 [Magicicada septendecim]QBM07989.1 NADH dehydrogenase subunit 1 [Magicicada septendecim]QBM08002.1 NADH dehydrogenase subunit 1 [Magicicada septendecim]